MPLKYNASIFEKGNAVDRRMTCLNCMDGRVQLPVLTWIKSNYPVDFVDVITEAGIDGVLAKQEDINEILRSIAVSVNINKSNRLFIVGHHDCRGNPVGSEVHHTPIKEAVRRLKPHWSKLEVSGLWVNSTWNVELVAE
jgi:carbonic anhydrase